MVIQIKVEKLVGSRITNNISESKTKTIKSRFCTFIESVGGASIVSKDTEFSFGYLRGIIGSKTRTPSPRLVQILVTKYKNESKPCFTREYLRPDVSPAQWRVIEAEIETEAG